MIMPVLAPLAALSEGFCPHCGGRLLPNMKSSIACIQGPHESSGYCFPEDLYFGWAHDGTYMVMWCDDTPPRRAHHTSVAHFERADGQTLIEAGITYIRSMVGQSKGQE